MASRPSSPRPFGSSSSSSSSISPKHNTSAPGHARSPTLTARMPTRTTTDDAASFHTYANLSQRDISPPVSLRDTDTDRDDDAVNPPPTRKPLLVALVVILLFLLGFSTTSSPSSYTSLASTSSYYLASLHDYSPVPTRFIPYLPSFLRPRPSLQPQSHPIVPLLRDARATYTTLLSRQSKSLPAAISAYRTRYARSPPPGFAAWYAFARGRNHTFVDEYDSLMRDLKPFLDLPPDIVRARTEELRNVPSVSIVSVRKGVAQVHSKSGRWAPALAVQEMMGEFVDKLPDMDLPINERMEGRVLERKKKVVTSEDLGEDSRDVNAIARNESEPAPSLAGFKAEWRDDGSVWEFFRRSCPPDSPSRRLLESVRSAEISTPSLYDPSLSAGVTLQKLLREAANLPALVAPATANQEQKQQRGRRRALNAAIPSTRELTFNTRTDSYIDICRRPSLHSLHSAFFSDTRSLPALYPLFSPSKPPGFSDILIPSHHYWSPSSEFSYEWEMKRGGSSTPTDVPWERKDDRMFWRGKVTRGASTPVGHEGGFQKQRLVRMGNLGVGWNQDDEDDEDGQRLRRGVKEALERTLEDLEREHESAKGADQKKDDDEDLVETTTNTTTKPTLSPAALLALNVQRALSLSGTIAPSLGGGNRVLVFFNSTTSTLASLIAPSHLLNGEMMDVALSCDPSLGECQYMKGLGYRIEQPGPLSEAWKHKYVLDVDEVGFSPRWMAVMESRSAVVKSTIMREFWNDWVVPWFHYIPLASSYAESYNIQSFFTGPPSSILDTFNSTRLELSKGGNPTRPANPAHGDTLDGDKALREIGERGAEWKRRFARRDDMEVYMYRLLIEWARILSDDREKEDHSS